MALMPALKRMVCGASFVVMCGSALMAQGTGGKPDPNLVMQEADEIEAEVQHLQPILIV